MGVSMYLSSFRRSRRTAFAESGASGVDMESPIRQLNLRVRESGMRCRGDAGRDGARGGGGAVESRLCRGLWPDLQGGDPASKGLESVQFARRRDPGAAHRNRRSDSGKWRAACGRYLIAPDASAGGGGSVCLRLDCDGAHRHGYPKACAGYSDPAPEQAQFTCRPPFRPPFTRLSARAFPRVKRPVAGILASDRR